MESVIIALILIIIILLLLLWLWALCYFKRLSKIKHKKQYFSILRRDWD